MSDEEKKDLKRQFAEYSKYGGKLDRAVDAVLAGGVKESRFLPSGRRIFTVVGNMGDEFIDPERPYCSCSNFFFKVSSGKEQVCYHLLSHTIASRLGRVDVITFSDEEYGQVFSAIVRDVVDVLNRSGGP